MHSKIMTVCIFFLVTSYRAVWMPRSIILGAARAYWRRGKGARRHPTGIMELVLYSSKQKIGYFSPVCQHKESYDSKANQNIMNIYQNDIKTVTSTDSAAFPSHCQINYLCSPVPSKLFLQLWFKTRLSWKLGTLANSIVFLITNCEYAKHSYNHRKSRKETNGRYLAFRKKEESSIHYTVMYRSTCYFFINTRLNCEISWSHLLSDIKRLLQQRCFLANITWWLP